MPKWASRFWLRITEIRVQRIQEISGADICQEGIISSYGAGPGAFGGSICTRYGAPGFEFEKGDTNVVSAYRHLWDSINASSGFGWSTNPWVCAVSFQRVRVSRPGGVQ